MLTLAGDRHRSYEFSCGALARTKPEFPRELDQMEGAAPMARPLISISTHCGFGSPIDFRVVVPFLLNACGLVLVLATSAFLFLTDNLSIGTERFYFFAGLASALLAAVVLCRMTSVSLVIFSWCMLDLVLGLSSSVLERLGTGTSLLPANIFTPSSDSRFVYHALLQRVPRANWQQTIRYDGRNQKLLRRGIYAGTDFFDRDFFFSHNSMGLRGTEISEKDLEKPLIFAYGGSSTYDYTVTQGHTWVERLQAELNENFTILNFGVPGHNTTQHLIHTALYQGLMRKWPACAIYYVGWNDISNAYVGDTDAGYANFHALRLAVRPPEPWAAKYSPLLRLAYRETKRRFDTVPEARNYGFDEVGRGGRNDSVLERLFAEHVTTIIAINTSRGIRTVFIGQLLNRTLLDSVPNAAGPAFPLVSSQDVWPLQERYNSILKSASVSNGANYIDAGVEHFTSSDFADVGHFSAAGSKKFAHSIAAQLRDYCK